MSYVVLRQLQQLSILESHSVFIDEFPEETFEGFLGWPGFVVDVEAFFNEGELFHVALYFLSVQIQ